MNIDWPNLIMSAFAGSILGFSINCIVSWYRKVKVIFTGIEITETNFGRLFKIIFSLKGHKNPGKCICEISVGPTSTFAKWDETPNPLVGDKLGEFVAEKVPDTFYQSLYIGKEYRVPILIQDNQEYYIFDGWWFGKEKGYYSKPQLSKNDEIKIVIRGEEFSKEKIITLKDFVKAKNKKYNNRYFRR